MALYIAEIENSKGEVKPYEINAPNLEDATIEGTNYAESKGFEMLGIDLK